MFWAFAALMTLLALVRFAGHRSPYQQAVNSLNPPIRFWGKVVDHDGNPLQGVTIKYKTRGAYLPMLRRMLATRQRHGTATTDSSGAFIINGGKGDVLGLYGFTKSGYKLPDSAMTSFAYAGSPEIHHPDEHRPVIYTMWRESAIEPLYHNKAALRLPCDGTPITVDLETGSASTEGQLRVWLRRDPIDIQRGTQFPWSAKIEIVGGGLQKADDSGSYVAPEESYNEEILYEYEPETPERDGEWNPGIRQMFYFRTAQGDYGRLQLIMHADSQPPPCSLHVESWLNPSGSRLLYYDRKKRLMRQEPP